MEPGNRGPRKWRDRGEIRRAKDDKEDKSEREGYIPLPISPIALFGIDFPLCLGLLSLITISEEACQFVLAWPLN